MSLSLNLCHFWKMASCGGDFELWWSSWFEKLAKCQDIDQTVGENLPMAHGGQWSWMWILSSLSTFLTRLWQPRWCASVVVPTEAHRHRASNYKWMQNVRIQTRLRIKRGDRLLPRDSPMHCARWVPPGSVALPVPTAFPPSLSADFRFTVIAALGPFGEITP